MPFKKTLIVKGLVRTKQQDKDLHKEYQKIVKTIDSADKDLVHIVTSAFLAPSYGLAFSTNDTLKVESMSEKVEIKTLDPSKPAQKLQYNSLLEEHALEYYIQVPLLGGIKADVGKSVFKAISKKVIEDSIMITQWAFYFYLFFGVGNLLGLNSGLLGTQMPFIPDIIVGTMPFYSAQRLERGMSDRVLKYRAIGDIFLAHQRGGTDTLRVDMTLFGPYRNFYLLYLLSLQQKGEGRLKELKLLSTGVKSPPSPLPSDTVKVPKAGKVQYESHMTFPIITNNSIMLDMFLQTIEWHQTKDKGGSTITHVHLLFRKHIDPKGYTVFDRNDKTGHMDYGELASERARKELHLDTMWKLREIGKKVLQVGLFSGDSLDGLNRLAAEDPYITNISALVGGYGLELSNMSTILALM